MMLPEKTAPCVTHAHQDPAHMLCPGLFRSLTPGERKAKKLDVTYRFGDEMLHFTGYQPLAADDLRVLQALVALATSHKVRLGSEPKTEVGVALRAQLHLSDALAEQNGLAVHCTLRHLLQIAGYAEGGSNRKCVLACLHRLAAVSIDVRSGDRGGVSHLISYRYDLAGDSTVHVGVNPRITAAVVGLTPYVHIDMLEVRALRSDPARLIHQRLCAIVNNGREHSFTLDTLASYVWPEAVAVVRRAGEQDDKKANLRRQTAERARRSRVREVLIELTATGGWSVKYASRKVNIYRRDTRTVDAKTPHTGGDQQTELS